MEKGITKIVLTGGPCAGKTTALSKLVQRLSDIGYKPIVVSETATELINNGILPMENYINSFGFQELILRYQIEREKHYEMAANAIDCDKAVIICDRGAIDNKAYIDNDSFVQLLEENGLTVDSLRDSYDAIFHLKTAADGAEKFYTLENNIARSETIEEARDLDRKVICAWTGHPHLRVIDNSTDFETKINRLIAEVFRFLGEPVPFEIERKFLIKMPDLEEMIKLGNCRKIKILQTYLISEDPEIETRIRKRGIRRSYTYFYTTKKEVSNSTRIETEQKINEKQYLELSMYADTSLHQIIKERYCFVYENQYFELDIYPFWKDYAILEIELTEENKSIDIPDFINAIREVTEEVEFRNKSIARQIPFIKE